MSWEKQPLYAMRLVDSASHGFSQLPPGEMDGHEGYSRRVSKLRRLSREATSFESLGRAFKLFTGRVDLREQGGNVINTDIFVVACLNDVFARHAHDAKKVCNRFQSIIGILCHVIINGQSRGIPANGFHHHCFAPLVWYRNEDTIIGISSRVQEKSERCYELSGVQSKMARAAIGLGIRDLAAQAGVSPDTVARLERGEELKPSTINAIRTALEAAGVEFIAENGGGAGVRLKKTTVRTTRS